eukprot:376563-Lingulodinium_polyedra.AAC.1
MWTALLASSTFLAEVDARVSALQAVADDARTDPSGAKSVFVHFAPPPKSAMPDVIIPAAALSKNRVPVSK